MRGVLETLDDEPAAADAALDFWSQLAEAVRGTDNGSDAVAQVNARLRDVFETFVLDTVKDHVVGTLPVLQEDVVSPLRRGASDGHRARWSEARPEPAGAQPYPGSTAGRGLIEKRRTLTTTVERSEIAARVPRAT